VLELRTFTAGTTPATMTSFTVNGSSVWMEEDGFVVTSGLGLTTSAGPLQFGASPCGELFAQWVYVNGWAHTLTSSAVAAGSTSILLADVTGIYPGTALTVYDAPTDEPIVVGAFTGTSNTVPLTAPLRSGHPQGVTVSAL